MRKFDLSRALRNWHYLYPDKDDLIFELHFELASCHGTFKDRRGHTWTREYPQTVRNLTLMLLALEGDLDS